MSCSFIDDNSTSPETIVLFPFDNYSIPFRHGVQLELVKASRYEGNPVLKLGEPEAPDGQTISYYGTVIPVDGELRMWYLGGGSEAPGLRVCYAVSQDGCHWEKPQLGLVSKYVKQKQASLSRLKAGAVTALRSVWVLRSSNAVNSPVRN